MSTSALWWGVGGSTVLKKDPGGTATKVKAYSRHQRRAELKQ